MKMKIARRSILLATWLIGLLFTCFTTSASAKPETPLDSLIDIAPITEAYPESGVLLGQGWNSVASQKTPGVCVMGVEKPIPGNGATMNYSYLLDKEQLLDSMSISASASFKGWIGGGSLSSSFSQALKVDTSKTNILATVVTDKGGVQYAPAAAENNNSSQTIHFTPEAQKLLTTDLNAFTKLCGDGYVASRRDGGRLDLVFELSAAQREEIAATTAGASAHYGPVSGNISFNNSHRKTVFKEGNSVLQLQQGGDLTMITSAEGAQKKISDFALFEAAKSHPYRIAIYPYRLLPGYLKTAKTASFVTLRSYLSQSLRLADISKIYSDAVINPLNYYFPFQGLEREKELLAVARSASAASICLDKFVTWCSTTGDCNLGEALKKPEFKDRCEIFSSNYLEPEEALLAARLLIGLPQDGVQSVQKKMTEQNKGILTSYFVSTADEDRSPYWYYMRLLARAPLTRLRDVANIGPSRIGDQLEEVRNLCIDPKNPCAYLLPDQLAKASTDDKISASQRDAFRNWVLKYRLYPLSQTFCDISRSHPMCFETDDLFRLRSEIQLHTGEGRNFEVGQAVPVPPPPAPIGPPPPERHGRNSSCEGLMLPPGSRHECH